MNEEIPLFATVLYKHINNIQRLIGLKSVSATAHSAVNCGYESCI